MTTLEYALPVGGAIASIVAAWMAHERAHDAKRYRDEAYDLNEQSVACESRIRVMHDRVSDLHDCVREAVPVKPYQPTLATAADLVRYGMTQPVQDQATIQFDLPGTLDPEGRTGECR